MAIGFSSETPAIKTGTIALGYLTGFAVLIRMGFKNLDLQDQLAPKLEVRCGRKTEGSITGDTRLNLHDGIGWHSYVCRFFRLAVISTTGEVVTECRGLLTGIERGGEKLWGGDTQPLTFAPGGAPDSLSKTIHDTPEFLDLLCVTNAGAIMIAAPAMRWRFAPPAQIFSSTGDYILKIVIQGKSIRPIKASILFKWTGSWDTSDLELIE